MILTLQVETRLARLPCGAMKDSLLKTSLTADQWVRRQASFKLITYCVVMCVWKNLRGLS